MLGRRKGLGSAEAKLMALGHIRAKLMVADNDLTITYMNPSVIELMREVEADLQKELPHFSVDTLIGSNIDVFHKNPAHQRGLLAGLDKPHSATIKVGPHSFDLRVSPLREGARRLGYVVEWADAKERLLNLDFAAQIKAIGRSQAVIAFKPDGTILTANENFLRTLGYSLDEVVGKNHSMFVEPSLRDSAEYQDFWARLRRGDYEAARFKRIGKGGRAVWIEGSYNPIFDMHGRVEKVVKFATDVSAQMQLLADLKHILDNNFGEIDGAIGISSGEASSAAQAAEETSHNVLTVARSADELAASVAEIAQSMARSRSASEAAFAQVESGDESTKQLASAAQAMNGIVSLIQGIAGQINLLSLNATIEAARAGEAGKGFAVVASEVKNLANQAAKATAQISQEIGSIQATSAAVAEALGSIRQSIDGLRDHVATTAAAVEEQSAVTRGMSENMSSASHSVQCVTRSVQQITSAVTQVSSAVSQTREAVLVLAR